jgi:hypothetical protein
VWANPRADPPSASTHPGNGPCRPGGRWTVTPRGTPSAALSSAYSSTVPVRDWAAAGLRCQRPAPHQRVGHRHRAGRVVAGPPKRHHDLDDRLVQPADAQRGLPQVVGADDRPQPRLDPRTGWTSSAWPCHSTCRMSSSAHTVSGAPPRRSRRVAGSRGATRWSMSWSSRSHLRPGRRRGAGWPAAAPGNARRGSPDRRPPARHR